MKFSKKITLILTGVLFFFFSGAAQASIEITEIMYNLPGSDTDREWAEVYNLSSAALDLTGWKFNDGSNHKLISTENNDLILQPYQWAVFVSKPEKFLEDQAGFDGKMIDTVLNLKNTSSTVSILDASGNVIDSVFYTATLGANGNARTLEKNDAGLWQESLIDGGTPGEINSCQIPQESEEPPEEEMPGEQPEAPPEESPDSTLAIVINEFLPNPQGKDTEGEFIEIKNLSGFEVHLSGWQLKDKSEKTFTFHQETIPANSFLATFYSRSKISLNNSGEESISLYDPSGELVNSISYDGCQEGLSYNLTDQGWQWSSLPTPGFANIILTEEGDQPSSVETTGDEVDDQGSAPSEAEEPRSYEQYSDKIYINEFIANPEGKDQENEWIELYNDDAETIDLLGWQIDDMEGGSGRFAFGEASLVEPGQYLVLARSETKIALNNNGDQVRLFYPNGDLAQEIEYFDSEEGWAIARQGSDEYVWTSQPTPGEKNIILQKTTEESGKPKKVTVPSLPKTYQAPSIQTESPSSAKASEGKLSPTLAFKKEEGEEFQPETAGLDRPTDAQQLIASLDTDTKGKSQSASDGNTTAKTIALAVLIAGTAAIVLVIIKRRQR